MDGWPIACYKHTDADILSVDLRLNIHRKPLQYPN